VPPPVSIPARKIRLGVKLDQSLTFSSEGDDLKPPALETLYTSVGLYLNLTRVTPKAPGSGNYWILYTTKWTLQASF